MSIESMFSLKDKVAVVIGGTSGIGKAIAMGYVKAGATVISSSRGQDKVDATAAELEALGSRTLRMTSDVHDRASLDALCKATVDTFGRVDILVVTSGALFKAPSAEMSEEDFCRVVDANLNGSFRANQIFGRQMIAQGGGVIIDTCSLTSFVSFGEVTPYAASKAGVLMLIKSLACEWAKYNIRVNGIAPGVFRTSLNSKALDTPGRSESIIAHTPMGKIGNVDDLAGTAIYLASDASSFVTGQIIAVDGGFLAKGI